MSAGDPAPIVPAVPSTSSLFVDQGGAPAGLQMAVLGLVFVAIALVSDSTWGMVSGTARQWLSGRSHRMERLSAFGGAVMIGLGLRLALTGRKD